MQTGLKNHLEYPRRVQDLWPTSKTRVRRTDGDPYQYHDEVLDVGSEKVLLIPKMFVSLRKMKEKVMVNGHA